MNTRTRVNSAFLAYAVAFHLLGATTAQCGIASSADLNTLTPPSHQGTSLPNSSVSSNVSYTNGVKSGAAFGRANSKIQLGAYSTSSNIGLSNHATASGYFFSDFRVVNGPNSISNPLTFNFDVHGSLSARTTFNDIYGVSIASMYFRVETSHGHTGGAYHLLCEDGFLTPRYIGQALTGGVDLQMQAFLSAEPNLPGEFALGNAGINAALDAVGYSGRRISLTSYNPNDVELFDSYALAIGAWAANQAFTFLPTGVAPKVTFEATYTFDGGTSVTADVAKNDYLLVRLLTDSVASSDAEASALYENSLDISMITVPYDYPYDISTMLVVFDSGITIPVTRAAVPEPSSILFVGLFVAVVLLRRQQK